MILPVGFAIDKLGNRSKEPCSSQTRFVMHMYHILHCYSFIICTDIVKKHLTP